MPQFKDPVTRARLRDAREFKADAYCLARVGRHLNAVPLLHDAAMSLLLAVAHRQGIETPARPTLPDVLACMEGRNTMAYLSEIVLDRLALADHATRALRATEPADLKRRGDVPPNIFTEADRGLKDLEAWALDVLMATPEPEPVREPEPEHEDDPSPF